MFHSEKLFQIVNNTAMLLIGLLMLLPMVNLLAVSLSSAQYVQANDVYLWPKGFSLHAYDYVMGQGRIWRAFAVSVYITVVGTLLALFFTTTISYSLSRTYMPARSLLLKLILLTFIFSVPLIPYFLLVKQLHMLNTLWSLMIPGALGAWYVFITKTFFQGLPAEMFDAGRIDGCSEFGLFSRVAIPLSLPVVATIGLFHAVSQWNSYFGAIIFIREPSLYPVQVLVREMVILNNLNANLENYSAISEAAPPEQLKAAVILVVTFPIVLVYPFIQRHFVKGAMLGSLKG